MSPVVAKRKSVSVLNSPNGDEICNVNLSNMENTNDSSNNVKRKSMSGKKIDTVTPKSTVVKPKTPLSNQKGKKQKIELEAEVRRL